MTNLDDLSPYLRGGWDLIPLRRRNKIPRDREWPRIEYSLDEVPGWVESGYNVGVRLREGELVIDVDVRALAPGLSVEDTLLDLEMETGLDLATCPRVLTGGGGFHYYLKMPAGLKIRNDLPHLRGIEYKTKGRQVLAAGSVHPNGTPYRWDGGFPPLDSAPEAPSGLVAAITKPQGPCIEAGGVGELEIEGEDGLEGWLAQLDVEAFGVGEHDRWLQVMMAAHKATAGRGREIFVAWCAGDPHYAGDAEIIRARWDSLDPEGPVGLGTLVEFIRDAGGDVRVPMPPPPPFPDDLGELELPEGARAIPPPGADPPAGPDDARALLNLKHCVVLDHGRGIIYALGKDPELGGVRWVPMSRGDLAMVRSNQQFFPPGANRPIGLVDAWMAWEGRRTYPGGARFDPGNGSVDLDGGRVLNLWTGWGVDEPVAGSGTGCPMTLQYFLDVLADGNSDHADYILNWCAWLVQRPCDLPRVALVLKGARGAGKSWLVDKLLGPIVGEAHSISVARPEQLAGRFNAHLQSALLVSAEEALWAGNKAQEGALKELITQDVISYEPKGRPIRRARNFAHLVMTSNEDWVVPAGLDERRFAVFEVSGARRRDAEYWVRMKAELDGGGLEAFFHVLQGLPLREIPAVWVPQTRALAEQKEHSLDPVPLWWLGCLQDGVLPGQHEGDWAVGVTTANRDALAADLAADVGSKFRQRAVATQLGIVLRRYVPGLKSSQVQKDGRRFRTYTFPSLGDCRAAWETLVGPISWD